MLLDDRGKDTAILQSVAKDSDLDTGNICCK